MLSEFLIYKLWSGESFGKVSENEEEGSRTIYYDSCISFTAFFREQVEPSTCKDSNGEELKDPNRKALKVI